MTYKKLLENRDFPEINQLFFKGFSFPDNNKYSSLNKCLIEIFKEKNAVFQWLTNYQKKLLIAIETENPNYLSKMNNK
jgi:hypothetical protein